MLRKIYYALPPTFRFWVRRLYYLPNDLFSKSDTIQPPKGLIYTGSGDFLQQGKDWLQFFIQEVGLQKEHHFLDIGSGIGRIALPLTAFLTQKYEGFEAMQVGTDWCKANISTRFPHFHFQHIALYNDLYNSEGINAAEFQFPYENDSFDMACSISVFTHMVGAEVGNYLEQTHRVLKKGGHLIATFFILDDESSELMQKSNNPFNFKYKEGNYALMDKNVKSANVAFQKDYLTAFFAQIGFEIIQVHKGYWSGLEKAKCRDFQDIIILQKK